MNFTDEDILQYCDGAMTDEQARDMLEAAQHDSELAHRIKAMQASQLPYQTAFSQQPIPAVPEALIHHVESMVNVRKSDRGVATAVPMATEPTKAYESSQQARRLSWSHVGIAASLAICFLLGHSMANRQNEANHQTVHTAQNTQDNWVRRVADYQTLYVENTVADIVGDVDDASSLFRRMQSQSTLKTGLPDLSQHGYTFVRAQELGYNGDPLVQLVYFKPGVAPLALCYMPSSDEQSAIVRIGDHEQLRTADWIQDGQRFVIVGEESAAVMQSLYKLTREHWI